MMNTRIKVIRCNESCYELYLGTVHNYNVCNHSTKVLKYRQEIKRY